jgi:myosin heavy subunit
VGAEMRQEELVNQIEELCWDSDYFEEGQPREFAQIVALAMTNRWLGLVREREDARTDRDRMQRKWDAARMELVSVRGDLKAANAKYERLYDVADSTDRELAAANARLEMWWKELERANGVRDKYKAENVTLRERIAELETERDSLRKISLGWTEKGQQEFDRANAAEAERDRLQARIDKALALADEWAYKGEFGWGPWQAGDGPDFEGSILDKAASDLRAALAADTPTTATAEGSGSACVCGHRRKRHQWVTDRRDFCSDCDCNRYKRATPTAEGSK